MPTEAAHRFSLVRDLPAAGRVVVRINCAHDDEIHWAQMVKHLDRARRETVRECRVLVGLSGPKLRTGRIQDGAHAAHWKPRRDVRGCMAGPARLFVKAQSRSELPPAHFGLVLAVEDDLSRQAQPGGAIRMRDCRGRMRRLIVKGIGEGYCGGESDQSAFVEQGALVQLVRAAQVLAETRLAEIEHVEPPLLLKTADLLMVTDERQAGRSPRLAPNGEIVEAARIPGTLPEAFAFVKPGERVAFDDGAI